MSDIPEVVPIRVLVVDSSRITSQAISTALQSNGFQVFYATPDAKTALETAERESVEVALISGDLGAQEASGYELTEKLRAALPHVQVIVILENSDRDSTISAFRAGARGIFCRTSSLEVLTKCIRRVHEGQIWASSADLEHLIDALRVPLRLKNASGADLLSKRERAHAEVREPRRVRKGADRAVIKRGDPNLAPFAVGWQSAVVIDR